LAFDVRGYKCVAQHLKLYTRYIYLNEPFVFLGRYNGVLAYPTHLSLLCTFCSSVPAFAVSLPSVHTSR
ncbi:MAG: hypothetical protein V4608_16845, partial [Bacteroidota bacterium]